MKLCQAIPYNIVLTYRKLCLYADITKMWHKVHFKVDGVVILNILWKKECCGFYAD